MIRALVLLIALLLATPAWGQATASVNTIPGSIWTYLGPTFGSDWVFPPNLSFGYVPNNAALVALLPSTPQVFRAGFYAPGDGGAGMYTHTAAPCSLSGGVGDNGSQVKASDGGCWIADFSVVPLNVLQFGAKPDLSNDATAMITAADAAGLRLKMAVLFPGGSYLVSGCINQTAHRWQGVTRVATTIKTNSATVCIINMATAGVETFDMELGATVTRTAGSYIVVGTNDVKLVRLLMSSPYDGITANTGTVNLWMDDVEVFDNINDGVRVNYCFNCQGNHLNLIGNTTSLISAGLHLLNAGDFSCFNCNIIHSFTGIRINPGPGQSVSSVKMIGGFVDHASSESMRIDPSGNGLANRMNFTGMWFASSPVNNINIAPGTVAEASGITFNDCDAYLSADGAGLAIGARAHDIIWNGGKIAQNKVGVFIADAHHVVIANSMIGSSGGLLGNSFVGITIGGNSSYIDIHDIIEIPANGSPFLAYSATGPGNRIVGNPGYNPIGVSTITCPASPCEFGVGPYAATVYGFGGDVTSVLYNGYAVVSAIGGNPWQINVGPNDIVRINYTSPPLQILETIH